MLFLHYHSHFLLFQPTYCNFVLNSVNTDVMSSLSSITNDIEIHRPELWSLVLRIGETSVKFILFNEEEENSLISRELPIDNSSKDYLKALENCIYDNPVLIQDFKKIIVSVDSSHFVVLPIELAEDETVQDILEYMYVGDDGDYNINELITSKSSLACLIPRGVLAFLQRTFNMPKIVHHLTPLCVYSAEKCQKSGISRMFVHLYDNRMDMCVFGKDELLMTNTFHLREKDEAVFYMLNAWQNLGLDVRSDELQISGDKALRDTLTPQLRKYINYVMPMIFPVSAMKIGQDAIKAPFDLILLSQCVS